MLQPNIISELIPYASSFGLIAFAVTKSLRHLIVERQEGKCADCGTYVGNRLEIHHKLPKALGGSNHPDNLVGLCGEGFADCHQRWDEAAWYHHRLPDGTPLHIPQSIRERK